MNYTIKDVSAISGISKRTIRFYDEIGLLKPIALTESNYRIYDDTSLDILQQILIYKELDMDLKTIKAIINKSEFDVLTELYNNYDKIEIKKERLAKIQLLIKDTISNHERNEIMSNAKKFEAFKEKVIENNEQKYGDELRSKYDKTTIESSNEKIRKMSKYQMKHAELLEKEIKVLLKDAVLTATIDSVKARDLCKLHQEWIKMYWPVYKIEAHMELVEMYLQDDRFNQYYENIEVGATLFLRDAMKLYLNK